MQRSLGTTLLALGTTICVLGALGLTLGMFVTIPEAIARTLVRAAGFSAPFLVGGAFMVAGAVIRRAQRASAPGTTSPADVALGDPARARPAAELPAPAVVPPPHVRPVGAAERGKSDPRAT